MLNGLNPLNFNLNPLNFLSSGLQDVAGAKLSNPLSALVGAFQQGGVGSGSGESFCAGGVSGGALGCGENCCRKTESLGF